MYRHSLTWCSSLIAVAMGVIPTTIQARSFYTAGAGGVPLAVSDAGPANGPEILFLHGLGQGRESFRPQFDSNLVEKYHLVAFDLRGHGMSGKPWEEAAYTDPAVWSEDVARVMAATGLTRPVLVAWSYGTLIAADYVRARGIEKLAGLMLIGALGGFVDTPPRLGPMEPNMIRAHQLQPSPDLADQEQAVRLVIPYLTGGSAAGPWGDTALTLGLMVPPYVQGPLRKHFSRNEDLTTRLKLPVMIIHGRLDTSEPQTMVDTFLARVPDAEESRYDTAGHSPFAEDPARFNRELGTFVDRVWKRSK